MARLAQARLDGLRVVASAATLVEARDPSRAASNLLAQHRWHGHQHAMDAMVAATALAAPPPRILLTSDTQDLAVLCGESVRVVKT